MNPLLRCLLLLMPIAASAQQSLPSTFAVSSTVSLRIWLPAGKLRLETWDRDSVRITGSVGRNSVFFAGGRGASAKLGVSTRAVDDTRLAEGDLVVTVPRRAHIWVKMTDGEFVGSGGTGELEVLTVAGTITIANTSGVVSIDAIDAAVAVSRVTGAVRVTGGGGRVTLADLTGTLTASTISGALELSGSSLPDAILRTIGGRLTVRGVVATKALLELETHDGDIDLFLSKSMLPSLTLSSRSGVIRNPFKGIEAHTGTILVRSFRGDINVRESDGIERRKPIPPP